MGIYRERFVNDGYAIIPGVLSDHQITDLCTITGELPLSSSVKHRRGSVFGIRNLLATAPGLKEFAECPEVKEIVSNFLGAGARVARSIYFDKTANANWKVPWHQDLTIAVKEKCDHAGYRPWTKKAGVWHVQPPVEIMQSAATLRFHLDDTDDTNGALKVIPATHQLGRLSAEQIRAARAANESVVCSVKSGDCIVMHPLLLHSSSVSSISRCRRIIHIEYSSARLPDSLELYES